MNDRLANTWARGCLTQIGFQFLVAIVILGGAGACVLVSFLVPVGREYRMIVWAVGFLGFMFLLIAGIVVWGISSARKRAHSFDEGFTPYGLQGSSYLINGRQYHGKTRGRQVDVYFSRGPQFEVHVSADVKTRLGVGLSTALGRAAGNMMNKEPIQIDVPEFEDLILYPEDEPWARGFLEDRVVQKSIRLLMGDDQTVGLRSLQIGPNALSLTLRRVPLRILTAQNIRAWMDAILDLAAASEAQPTPTTTVDESDFVRRSRTERSKAVGPIAIGILAAVIICPVVFVGGFFAVLAALGQFP